MNRLLQFFDRYPKWTFVVLGAVQGLLSTLSLAPFNFPFVAWLCPWPLFYFAARYRKSVGKLFLAGAVSSFFLCLFSFYWLLYAFSVFGGMPAPLALIAFVPYTVVLNLKMPAFVILLGLCMRPRLRGFLPPRWLSVGLLALLTDFFAPQIFPWYWGNLLAGNLVFAQSAEITGIYGLSFLLFSGSYLLYKTARIVGSVLVRRRTSRPFLRRLFGTRRTLVFTPVAVLIFASAVFGTFRIFQLDAIQKNLPVIRVGALQPNSILEKADGTVDVVREIGRTMAVTIPRLARMAQEAGEGRVDLLVLPESAIPYYGTGDTEPNRLRRVYAPEFEVMVQLLALNWNVDVFLNEVTYEPVTSKYTGETRLEAYNSSVLYSRDGKRRDSYHKRILVAFGEYIPGREFMERTGLISLVPSAVRYSRFYPGPRSNLLATSAQNLASPYVPKGQPIEQRNIIGKDPRKFESEFPKDREYKKEFRFIPLICYEILIPEHIRSFFAENEENPDFMVNITQDGWYGDTVETFQHYELGRLRAIETRRAIVRSTNSGSSGFVDILGRYANPLAGAKFTRWGTEDYQVWDVPVFRGSPTLYVLFGNTWIGILSGLFGLWTIVRFVRRRRRQTT